MTLPKPAAGALSLRRAGPQDEGFLLRLRNDRKVRRYSLSRVRIPLEEHRRWFRNKLADPLSRIYLIEGPRGRPLGQARIDARGGARGEVSIALIPAIRGGGLGTLALLRAARRARLELGLGVLVAHILPDNVPSAVAFLKAGFRFSELRKVRGRTCYRLEKRL